ncbi:MAG: hypothetical protein H6Q13_3487 [Bacteroidetes bacterium]|nr:hypothetical protein [Bacteroidota bacterium]
MKKLILCVGLLITTLNGYAQTNYSSKSEKDSILSLIPTLLEDINYKIRGLERYKLYPTENIYTLLQLDTKTGRIVQIQWSLNSNEELSVDINSNDLSFDTGCGTFELYPTKNMYQFILLNKEVGTRWHVQWGFEKSNRWIRRIY